MKAIVTLIGAGTAIVFGVNGLSVWYASFLNILSVLVPSMLLVGSGLAIYIGISEIKDGQEKTCSE